MENNFIITAVLQCLLTFCVVFLVIRILLRSVCWKLNGYIGLQLLHDNMSNDKTDQWRH